MYLLTNIFVISLLLFSGLFINLIYADTPRQQWHLGILPANIKCASGFVVIKKLADTSIGACVKSSTAQKLVERGWGTLQLVAKFEKTPIILTTNKTEFTVGDTIPVKIKNISNISLGFPNTNYGTELFSKTIIGAICCGAFSEEKTLQPNEEIIVMLRATQPCDCYISTHGWKGNDFSGTFTASLSILVK